MSCTLSDSLIQVVSIHCQSDGNLDSSTRQASELGCERASRLGWLQQQGHLINVCSWHRRETTQEKVSTKMCGSPLPACRQDIASGLTPPPPHAPHSGALYPRNVRTRRSFSKLACNAFCHRQKEKVINTRST